jgi:multimeric flavodoxin WrbA
MRAPDKLGSPKKDGNIDILGKEILRAAKTNGH